MSSLDIKTFPAGHKRFLKIEKSNCIVRKYLANATCREEGVLGLLVHGVQPIVVGEGEVVGSIQAGVCSINWLLNQPCSES